MVEQILPKRYIDKEKLVAFWSTHKDFGPTCRLRVCIHVHKLRVLVLMLVRSRINPISSPSHGK
jgi:hypothetical protein